MNTNQTPAPWIFIETGEANNYMINESGKWLASVYMNGNLYPEQQKKILQKIVTVNELLEALQFCQSVIKSQGMFDLSERMAYDKAENAIKKATE